jgi:hypothetical protein
VLTAFTLSARASGFSVTRDAQFFFLIFEACSFDPIPSLYECMIMSLMSELPISKGSTQHSDDLIRVRHLILGHPAEPLIATLARAVLREDSEFHTYQILEAGVQQYRQWGEGTAGRHILVAVARYVAAHSPTERAQLQTAMVARRLSLGQAVHEEAGEDDAQHTQSLRDINTR